MIVINGKEYSLNENIKSQEIRMKDGRLISKTEALEIAKNDGLDLIEISNYNGVSVCLIESYDKFLYNQKKMQKTQNNAPRGGIKEIKIGLNINQNDLIHKAKKVKELVEENYKVKASVLLKGRENTRVPQAIELIDNLLNLSGTSYERNPKSEGSFVFAIITKKK